MRPVRLSILFLVLVFIHVPARSVGQEATQATRDPQAVAILTQAVQVGGGAGSTKWFRATGHITYYWAGEEVKGAVAIRSRGIGQLRLDANVPEGTRSWAVKGEGGSMKEMDGALRDIPYFSALNQGSLLRPALRIAAALNDPSFSISQEGTEQIDGRSATRVRLRPVLKASADPGGHIARLRTFDVVVDTSTFLILRLEDTLQGDSIQETYPRELTFSDYQVVQGMLVPMSITEKFGGQRTWSLRIESAEPATDLTDRDFEL